MTVSGGSDVSNACLLSLEPLFLTGKDCTADMSTPYSFDCVYQPSFVAQSSNILVFENFFYTSSALAVAAIEAGTVTGNGTINLFPLLTTPNNFRTAANKICSTEWSVAQSEYPKDSQPKDTTLKLCFSSSYAATFLTKGIHLAEDKVVTVQREVEGSEIEWALGKPLLSSLLLSFLTRYWLN